MAISANHRPRSGTDAARQSNAQPRGRTVLMEEKAWRTEYKRLIAEGVRPPSVAVNLADNFLRQFRSSDG